MTKKLITTIRQQDKDTAALKEMAKMVTDMENQYDSSMEGIYLDRLVTNYVNIKAESFCEMFDYIMEHQKDDHDSYGDIDTTINKFIPKGKFEPWERYKDKDNEYIISAMHVSDNCTCADDSEWVIMKVVERPTKSSPLSDSKELMEEYSQTSYHVRSVKKKVKDINQIIQYEDLRDNGYIVTFETEKFTKKKILAVKDNRAMLHHYTGFKHITRNLLSAYLELKSGKHTNPFKQS